MKSLELNQMEKFQGGSDSCAFAYLMGGVVIVAGIATGGVGLLFAFAGATIMEDIGCN